MSFTEEVIFEQRFGGGSVLDMDDRIYGWRGAPQAGEGCLACLGTEEACMAEGVGAEHAVVQVPGPSTDAQGPYIKWCSTVSPV